MVALQCPLVIKSSAANSNLTLLLMLLHCATMLVRTGVSDKFKWKLNSVLVLVPGLWAKGMCRGQETWTGLLFADLHPDPASSLYGGLKTHLHFLKSEFVSTGLTHFPVEIFLFVQNLLRAVVMLMDTGIFLKHTAPYRPPQLWKPDEDWQQCIIPHCDQM